MEIMVVVVVIALLAAIAMPQFQKIRSRSQDSAVIANARQIANAASQYYLESGSSAVELKDIVGPDKYIKSLATVASETYPDLLLANQPLTISGVAGARTITYSP